MIKDFWANNEINDDVEIITFVSENPNEIGFVDNINFATCCELIFGCLSIYVDWLLMAIVDVQWVDSIYLSIVYKFL